MQITLDEEEITTAVENYVRSQINIASDQSIDINFSMGRNPANLSATLAVRSADVVAPNKPASRPFSSAPKEIVSQDMAEEVSDSDGDDDAKQPPEEAPAESKNTGKPTFGKTKPKAVEDVTEAEDTDEEKPADKPGNGIFSKRAG